MLFEINMPKAFSQVFIVAVMLITFIGQAMAFSSSASSESGSESLYQKNHQSNLDADIAGDDNNSLSNSVSVKKHNDALTDCADLDCCEVDCCTINVCENDCVCAASGCLSLMFLNNGIADKDIKGFTETLTLTNLIQTQSISSNPYRPPIVLS